MAGKDIIMATGKELRKLHIVKKVIEGGISQVEAAEHLDLSSRQIRRLQARVFAEGDEGILHRSRGRKSNNALDQEIHGRVIGLYRNKYYDFGPLFFTEKLREDEGIIISVETVRTWLMCAGLWQKSSKKQKHRQRRERRRQYGHLIQIDGSHHQWLEERGPRSVLMAYIDDATNRVFARFYSYEGTIPAMDSFLRYVRKNGLPHSLYLDKHSTYKSASRGADRHLFEDIEMLSQFERAMAELDVEVIHAHSPQAKGRVERLFRTLQDRLVKEMRLSNISTMEDANAYLVDYLVRYNRRFALKASDRGDMHRRVPKGMNLRRILCIKKERVVRNDHTILYGKEIYQIMEAVAERTVMVEEKLNGTLEIMLNDRALPYRKLEVRPEKLKTAPRYWVRKPNIPPAKHPWRTSEAKRLDLKKQIKNPASWARA
jgi:transposase